MIIASRKWNCDPHYRSFCFDPYQFLYMLSEKLRVSYRNKFRFKPIRYNYLVISLPQFISHEIRTLPCITHVLTYFQVINLRKVIVERSLPFAFDIPFNPFLFLMAAFLSYPPFFFIFHVIRFVIIFVIRCRSDQHTHTCVVHIYGYIKYVCIASVIYIPCYAHAPINKNLSFYIYSYSLPSQAGFTV